MPALLPASTDGILNSYAEGILGKYSAEFAGAPCLLQSCTYVQHSVLPAWCASMLFYASPVTYHVLRSKSANALQMGVQMEMIVSLLRRCSVSASSYTAHKAVLLSASSVWRPCTMMMQSGTAPKAVAVYCICCAYKLGAANNCLQLLTLLLQTLPGVQTGLQ